MLDIEEGRITLEKPWFVFYFAFFKVLYPFCWAPVGGSVGIIRYKKITEASWDTAQPPEDFILSGMLAYCQAMLPLKMVLLVLRAYKQIIKLY